MIIIVFFSFLLHLFECKTGLYRRTYQKNDCTDQYESSMFFYNNLCYPFNYVHDTTWSMWSYSRDTGIARFVSGCQDDACTVNCEKNETHKTDICEFAFKTPHGNVYEYVQVTNSPSIPDEAYYMAYFMNNDSTCSAENHAYGFVETAHCSEKGKTASYKIYCDNNDNELKRAEYDTSKNCTGNPTSVSPVSDECSVVLIEKGYYYKMSCDFFV